MFPRVRFEGAVLYGLLFLFVGSELFSGIAVRVVPPRGEFSAAYFRYDLEPGETARGSIVVENDSIDPVEVVVYPVEALNTPEGSLVGPLFGAPPTAPADWVTVSLPRFTLRGNEERRVDFTFRVPEDASPGDHLALLFVQEAPAARAESEAPAGDRAARTNRGPAQFTLQIATRFGVTVWNRVPGSAPREIEIAEPRKEIRDGRLWFDVDIRNPGATLLKPSGGWVLRAPNGSEVVSRAASSLGYLLPRGSLRIAIPIESGRPLVRGTYELVLDVVSGEEGGDAKPRTLVFPMELP